MYVHPFWLGVLVTVVAEIAALIIYALYLAGKKVRK